MLLGIRTETDRRRWRNDKNTRYKQLQYIYHITILADVSLRDSNVRQLWRVEAGIRSRLNGNWYKKKKTTKKKENICYIPHACLKSGVWPRTYNAIFNPRFLRNWDLTVHSRQSSNPHKCYVRTLNIIFTWAQKYSFWTRRCKQIHWISGTHEK